MKRSVLDISRGTLAELAGGRAASRSGRLAHDREQHVRSPHHSGKPFGSVLWNPHRDLRAAGLIEGLGQLLPQPLSPSRVQLDRDHSQAVAAEADRQRSRLAKLDSRTLESQQVL